MFSGFRAPRSISLSAGALGLALVAVPAQASTIGMFDKEENFGLVFTAQKTPVNDCAGAFGTAPDCRYNSEDNWYTNGSGSLESVDYTDPITGGVSSFDVLQSNLMEDNYHTFDHGLLFSFAKVNFEGVGEFCCTLIDREDPDGNFGGTVGTVEVGGVERPRFFLEDGGFFRFGTTEDGKKFWEYNPTVGENLWSIFAFSVKGGNTFTMWEASQPPMFSGLQQTSTGWCAPSMGGGECDVSHITFYGQQLTPIPLPAAGWLLLTGLGGLALMRRRKRDA